MRKTNERNYVNNLALFQPYRFNNGEKTPTYFAHNETCMVSQIRCVYRHPLPIDERQFEIAFSKHSNSCFSAHMGFNRSLAEQL